MMEHIIGKIINPKNRYKIESLDEYLKFMGWDKLPNSVIDGYVWTQYLSEHDYKNVYLSDVENSKEDIIKQILKQLK